MHTKESVVSLKAVAYSSSDMVDVMGDSLRRRGLNGFDDHEIEDKLAAAQAIAQLSGYFGYHDSRRVEYQLSPSSSCLDAGLKMEDAELDGSSRSSTPVKLPHVRGAVMPSRADGNHSIKVVRKRKLEFDSNSKSVGVDETGQNSPKIKRDVDGDYEGSTSRNGIKEINERGRFVRTSSMCKDFSQTDSMGSDASSSGKDQRQAALYSFPNMSEDSYHIAIPNLNALPNSSPPMITKGSHFQNFIDIEKNCVRQRHFVSDYDVERSSIASSLQHEARMPHLDPIDSMKNLPEKFVEERKSRVPVLYPDYFYAKNTNSALANLESITRTVPALNSVQCVRNSAIEDVTNFCDRYGKPEKFSNAFVRGSPLADRNSNKRWNDVPKPNSLGCIDVLRDYYKRMDHNESKRESRKHRAAAHFGVKNIPSPDAAWQKRNERSAAENIENASKRNSYNFSISRVRTGNFGSLNCLQAYYKHMKSARKANENRVYEQKTGSLETDHLHDRLETSYDIGSTIDIPIDLSSRVLTATSNEDSADAGVAKPTIKSEPATDLRLSSPQISSPNCRVQDSNFDNLSSRTSTPNTIPDSQLPLKKRKKLQNFDLDDVSGNERTIFSADSSRAPSPGSPADQHCKDWEEEPSIQSFKSIEKTSRVSYQNCERSPPSVVRKSETNIRCSGMGQQDVYSLVGLQDDEGDLPLHIAVARESQTMVSDFVQIMRQRGVPLDTYNNSKQTPLHMAVIMKQPAIVRILLRGSASPKVCYQNGNTSIQLAVVKDSIQCLQALLEVASLDEIDHKNYNGMTALHLAVQLGRLDAVLMLLNAGASINAVDNLNGRTALYFATERNDCRIAEVLLSHGADPNICSYTGCTAVQAAMSWSYAEMIRLLERNSAMKTLI